MSVPRLYIAPSQLGHTPEGVLALGPEQSRYLYSVLRKRAGAHVKVFNANAGEWLATLTAESNQRKAHLKLDRQVRPAPTIPTTDIWLLCSSLKRRRLAYGVEKATELGVAAIGFVRCAFTDAPPPKIDKLATYAMEAAEQCGRLDVPKLFAPCPLSEALDALPPTHHILFCDEASDHRQSFVTAADFACPHWAVLIGPEAGFSADERTAVQAYPRVHRVNLGPNILRAETAIVVALSMLQFQRRAYEAK